MGSVIDSGGQAEGGSAAKTPDAPDHRQPQESPARRFPLSGYDARRRIWVLATLIFAVLIVYVLLQQWWIGSGMGRHFAKPIPPGEYSELEAWETPAAGLGPDSRFVLAETRNEDASTARFWYASPTSATVYRLNGEAVDKSEFEQALDDHPPMGVRALVEVDGKLREIDVLAFRP